MTKYETVIVFDSFLKEEDKKDRLTKVQNFIKNNGGEIQQLEEWGRKRLAYEINRKQYGNYVYIVFSGPGTLPKLLEREYRLEESILRSLTVKFDPRLSEMKKKAAPSKPAKLSPEKDAESSAEKTEEVVATETEEIKQEDGLSVSE